MSTNAPFFSIIIPTYNRVQLVARAIHSVFAQTFTDWEIILIDDGSTDATSEKLRAEFPDLKLKISTGVNEGRSAARNKGIDNATGNYICFLDSDDEFLPSHLEIIYQYLSEKGFPGVLVRTFAKLKYKDGKEELQLVDPIRETEKPIDYILGRSTLFPSQVCIHRATLGKIRFNPAFSLGEDTDFFVRLLSHIPLKCINETTVVFHVHEGNSQVGEMVKIHKAYLEVFQGLERMSELKDKCNPELISDLIQRRKKWLSASFKEKGNYPAFIVQKIKNIF